MRLFVFSAALVAFVASGYWTFDQWHGRTRVLDPFDRTPKWTIVAATNPSARAFVRMQDTSFWSSLSSGVLTSQTTVASQGSAVAFVHAGKSNDSIGDRGERRVILAPQSMATLSQDHALVLSGMVLIPSSSHNAKNEATVLVPKLDQGRPGNDSYPGMEPPIGSVHDLQTSGRVNFAWPARLQKSGAVLDFARDPTFTSIMFTENAGDLTSANINFADRSPGAWFVRLRFENKNLAYTAFNLVESQTPDRLQRLGRRWLTWRDSGLASAYRIEFSHEESFKSVAQSFQIRNREFDLSRLPAGKYFTRVTAAAIDGQEFTSRPLAIDVQEKSEILRAGLELNDPDLKLFARGWKIILERDEVSRIREGFVILRESELRGVKVADELFKGLTRNEYAKRNEILKSVIFELSRDESFTNPERVRADSDGELLPPALPLGILFVRLRRVEKDGTLGSYGPPSRLTTWLPAPRPRKTKPVTEAGAKEIEIRWDLETEVAGYEVHVSPDREFRPEKTTVLPTFTMSRKVALEPLGNSYWTVTALNEFGQRVSLPSDIQEIQAYKPVLRKLKTLVMPVTRDVAAITPVAPILTSPLDEAVVVGGATAKKYGKLQWDFDGSAGFEVQIATDGDFVNVIEKAKIDKAEYTLEGDLPEGALFWRVRKLKTRLWSESRRFELVYE